MIIYLVRHAESTSRRGLTDAATLGVGLSPLGILQARAVGKALRRMGVVRVVASSIERAAQTARIIAEATGASLSQDVRLGELIDSSGESLEAAVARLEAVVREAAVGQGDAALVTHRVVGEGYLAKLGYVQPRRLWMHSAAVSALEFKNGEPRLVFANRRFYSIPLFWEVAKRRLQFAFGL
jgi:broad specificity phosphatase PhoE